MRASTLGAIRSEGAPFCVSPLLGLRSWTGALDGGAYWALVEHMDGSLLGPAFHFEWSGQDYLVLNNEVGHCYVLVGDRSYYFVETATVPDAWVPPTGEVEIEQAGPKRVLGSRYSFGHGEFFAVYDSAIAGDFVLRQTVEIKEPGAFCTRLSNEPDFALLKVHDLDCAVSVFEVSWGGARATCTELAFDRSRVL